MNGAVGLTALAFVVLALVASAVNLRRRYLSGWTGAPARLVEVLIGASLLQVTLQVLGICGLLTRIWLLLATAAVMLGTTLLARGRRDEVHRAEADVPTSRLGRAVALVSISIVVAQWLEAARASYYHGILAWDSVHYHLTFAARFVQDHGILGLHRLDSWGATTWYPLDDELVHAAGMVLLGSDFLSLFLAFVSLAAVLLAAWCLAAPYGAGIPAIVSTCLLLDLVGRGYAGSASNDWASVWPLLAALALIVQAKRHEGLSRPVLVLIGLALGLCVGSKLTMLAPAAVTFMMVVALSRGARLKAAGVLLACSFVTGGFWYLRSLVVVGNPIPASSLGLGSLRFPRPAMPAFDDISFSVLHYLTDASVIRHYFLPGLNQFFGPAWPLVLLLALVGLVGTLVRSSVRLRWIALVGVASAVAYLVTPTSAAGYPGKPTLFVVNIRYALVAYVLGFILCGLAAARRGHATAFAVAVLGLQLVAMLRASAWLGDGSRQAGVLVVVSLLGCGAAVVVWKRSSHVLAVGAVLALGALLVALPTERAYERHRYSGAGNSRAPLFAALQAEKGARIGVVGVPAQYPYYGPRLENDVQYVGRLRQQSFSDWPDCRGFLSSVRDRRLNYVVVQRPDDEPDPAALAWIRMSPAATPVAKSVGGEVFRITGKVDPGACP